MSTWNDPPTPPGMPYGPNNPYPDDDAMVEIADDDYALYDQDWMAEAQPAPGIGTQYSRGMRSFEDHELWSEIRANGWSQPRGTEFLIKPDQDTINSRKNAAAAAVSFGPGGKLNARPGYPIVQWIEPEYAPETRERFAEMKASGWTIPPSTLAGWRHIINDEAESITRYKMYPTLGDALDEARRRERGGGYKDYEIWTDSTVSEPSTAYELYESRYVNPNTRPYSSEMPDMPS